MIKPGTRLALAIEALQSIVAADTVYRAGHDPVRGGTASIAHAALQAIEATPDEAGLTTWSLIRTVCIADNSGLPCSCHHDKIVRQAAPCLRRERAAAAIMASIGADK